mgnify:CR=1 FL=1
MGGTGGSARRLSSQTIDPARGEPGTVGDDPFTFIGNNMAFNGTAGEVRALWIASGQIVEGDVNGDKNADFSIFLQDEAHVIILSSFDFVL